MVFAGAYGAFWLVNTRLATDFLIATDEELEEVWWPRGRGLLRAAALAILAMLLLAGFVVGVDSLTTMLVGTQ